MNTHGLVSKKWNHGSEAKFRLKSSLNLWPCNHKLRAKDHASLKIPSTRPLWRCTSFSIAGMCHRFISQHEGRMKGKGPQGWCFSPTISRATTSAFIELFLQTVISLNSFDASLCAGHTTTKIPSSNDSLPSKIESRTWRGRKQLIQTHPAWAEPIRTLIPAGAITQLEWWLLGIHDRRCVTLYFDETLICSFPLLRRSSNVRRPFCSVSKEKSHPKLQDYACFVRTESGACDSHLSWSLMKNIVASSLTPRSSVRVL